MGTSPVKIRMNLLRKYAPVLGLLSLMILLLLFTTLPSLKMNLRLGRVQADHLQSIERLKEDEKRLDRLMEALDEDPITIENYLRNRFDGAKREGEADLDRSTR